MKELEIPEFKSYEEEAEFWDNLDTSPYMEGAEWFTLEWTEREDRCDRCGALMDKRSIDLHLAGGRVTLHNVDWYVCRTPRCGRTRLSPQVERLVEEIEDSVGRAITSQQETKQERYTDEKKYEKAEEV